MARSCGTCRDRRILCDRALPTCTQCTRSSRPCKGYGLRLSWPKAKNDKRSIVRGPLRGQSSAQKGFSSLVNASSWDIRMHHYLLGHRAHGSIPLGFAVPMPVNPVKFEDADYDLFQYFQTTASRALTTLGPDPVDLCGILMRISLSSPSSSATAVYRALLGFSSLHRYGVQSQAFEFKVSALNALAAASGREIGATEAIQHVAAGMLLCSFEIHKASCTSGQWQSYITGVKQVINASSLGNSPPDELGTLLDWVNYHDALARFTALHWREPPPPSKSLGDPQCKELFQVVTDPTPMLRSTPSEANALLGLLSEGCDLLSNRQRMLGPEYESALKLLKKSKALFITDSKNPILEIFHLAILIYLNRATNHAIEPASKTHLRIERAFSLLPTMAACERQFPLFVLACEARTDQERCTILDLLARTGKAVSSRSVALLTRLIEAVWVQDDLATGWLDYGEKLRAIIGRCPNLPTFV
ncbi:fungal-specific transcription factor domain-containing protein [Aspergillus californicus]